MATAPEFFGDGWHKEGKEELPLVVTGESLPLISFENEQFVVGDRAMELLRDMEPPIAVVAVAGLYRTGKSFLLNRVILQKPGFSVGSTVNACTKGIWMWSEPVITTDSSGRQVKVLVVDTEGIGAPTADASHDTRVFSLGLLLSSFFVYNSVGSIDEQALSNLSLVTNISKEIRVSAVKDDDEEEDDSGVENEMDASAFQEFLPAFLWVVRDFALQLEDTNGVEFGAEQYLENALKECRGRHAVGKNKIRDCLKQFFPERGCVTMVRPCLDEKNLQRLDSLPDSALRPEFMRQAKNLRERVMSEAAARPLTMQGNELSGSMLGFLCQAYSKAINEGGAPVIHDAWTYVCQAQRMRAEQQLLDAFIKEGATLVDKGLCPPVFRERLGKLQIDTVTKFGDLCRKLDYEDTEGVITAKLTVLLSDMQMRNHRHYSALLQEQAVADYDRLMASEAATFQDFRAEFGECQAEFIRVFVEPADQELLPQTVRDPYPDAPPFEFEAEAVWLKRTTPVVWRVVNRYYGTHEQDQARLQGEVEMLRLESRTVSERHGVEVERLRQEHGKILEQIKVTHDTALVKGEERVVVIREKLSDAELRIATLEAEVLQCSKASHERQGELEQKAVAEQSRAESAEGQLSMLSAEVEELQDLQSILEEKELELSGVTITRDRLQQQLIKVQREMETRKAEFTRVETTYRKEAREIQEKALASVDHMKQVRKTEQKRLKQSVDEERAVREQIQDRLDAVQAELDTLKQQKLDAAAQHETQVMTLRSQVEESDARLSTSHEKHMATVRQLENQAKQEQAELTAKEMAARDKTLQQEKEWSKTTKEMETRAVGAETRLVNQKRQLDQAELILQRKRAKTEDSQTSLELVKARAELEWLRRQTKEQDMHLTQNASRIMELEASVREHERSSDSQLTYMRLDYEHRIAALEEQLEK